MNCLLEGCRDPSNPGFFFIAVLILDELSAGKVQRPLHPKVLIIVLFLDELSAGMV